MSKKKRIHQIDRRNFLQGLGASVVALPMFDFFLNSNGTAFAQGAELPKRYMLLMNGVTPGRSVINNFLTPGSTGANYELQNSIVPLNGNYGDLRPHVGIYSNLHLPFAVRSSRDPAPTGGYKGAFHNMAAHCQLTGDRVDEGSDEFGIPRKRISAPSSDQALRAALNPNNQFVHINLSAQPKNYLGSTSLGRLVMQFGESGSRIAPQTSPRQAFNQLFFNLQDSDPRVEAERQLAVQKRQSVLDLLAKERVDFLNRELGARERSMLSDHFDHIRTLEQSVQSVASDNLASQTCRKPQDPGQDPPLGADYIGARSDNQDPNTGYSNEDLRADIMVDLIHMAFTCDISRHGTLRLTYDQSYINVFQIAGVIHDYHQLSHTSRHLNEFIQFVGWHVEKYARLVSKLADTPEGSGSVLDNSAVLLLSEGGYGLNSDNGDRSSAHSGFNMTTLVAGRVGGLNPGRHVATNRVHPSRILFSAMRAAGFQGNRLGDVSGVVSDMF